MNKNRNIIASLVLGTVSLTGVGAASAFAATTSPSHNGTAATSTTKAGHEAKLAKDLSAKLGVSQATVQKALETVRAQHKAESKARHTEMKQERAAHEAAIAKTLGVSTDKLQAAMKAGMPAKSGQEHFGHRHGKIDFAKVAKSLGVTEAKLKAAFDANRPAAPKAGEGQRPTNDPFATDLAKALNMDVSKVATALQQTRPAGAHFGGHGDRGPGFGGPQGAAPSSSSTASSSAGAGA